MPEPPHGRGALIASSPRSASWCAPEQLRRRPERRVAHTTLTCSAAPADAWMRQHGAPTSSGERRTVLRATSRPRRDVASGWARAVSRHQRFGGSGAGEGATPPRPLGGFSAAYLAPPVLGRSTCRSGGSAAACERTGGTDFRSEPPAGGVRST